MNEHKWTYKDDATQDIPQPEVSRAECVVDAATLKLTTNTTTDSVEPHDRCDTKCQACQQEEDKAVVHGVLTIVA